MKIYTGNLDQTALIFGAGKTGRGFAAHLAFLGGYQIVLIDKNRQLTNELQEAGQYAVEVVDEKEKSCTITIKGAYSIDDVSWQEEFCTTSLAFTAVFANNLPDLARDLTVALQKRFVENPRQVLTIITCENVANAAVLLKENVLKHLGREKEAWLSKYVGFSESIVFRTCLGASKCQPPLTVRANNFFELPCDGDAIKEKLHVYGLKPFSNFDNQLRRKIYTYNCINAVITYLGARKGYVQLSDAGNDAEVYAVARKAADETSRALVAEFNFDRNEQEEWTNAALQKFMNKSIPDPIERNGADPVRKLSRDDRLIGPALLALKHNIYPEGLLEGIVACFDYYDPMKQSKVADLMEEKGIPFVLEEICGLYPYEQLFRLIKEKVVKTGENG